MIPEQLLQKDEGVSTVVSVVLLVFIVVVLSSVILFFAVGDLAPDEANPANTAFDVQKGNTFATLTPIKTDKNIDEYVIDICGKKRTVKAEGSIGDKIPVTTNEECDEVLVIDPRTQTVLQKIDVSDVNFIELSLTLVNDNTGSVSSGGDVLDLTYEIENLGASTYDEKVKFFVDGNRDGSFSKISETTVSVKSGNTQTVTFSYTMKSSDFDKIDAKLETIKTQNLQTIDVNSGGSSGSSSSSSSGSTK